MALKNFILFILLMLLTFCSARENNDAAGQKSENGNQNDFLIQHDTANVIDDYLTNTNFDKLIQKLEDPQRLNWQNPDLVLDKLGDLSGKTVADLGAGSGYFTFRMSETAKKIIAIDIDNRFLNYIEKSKQELPENQAEKIETRLTEENDPSLENEEADIVLVVNTFHYINNRSDYFRKVKSGLKNNGFLVIVDFKNSNMPIAPPKELIVTPEVAFMELREAGFSEFSIDEKSLQYQYILIAK